MSGGGLLHGPNWNLSLSSMRQMHLLYVALICLSQHTWANAPYTLAVISLLPALLQDGIHVHLTC